MDSIDRQILAAKSPLEVKDPGNEYLERITSVLEMIHGNHKCSGENCPIGDILEGHAYLVLRIIHRFPHLVAVIAAKRVVTDVENNTVPNDPTAMEIAEKIRVAEDLNPSALLPQSMVN